MSNTITVNVVTSVSTGPTSGYFVIDGDFTSLFFPGFKFMLANPPWQSVQYTTASSTLSAGQTLVNVNSPVYGSIIAIDTITPITGPFVSGTYTPVTLTGGTGSGALATITNVGPGPIHALGTITGGSGYTPGTYTSVPLTGGTGSGAEATITVTGGFVTNVVISNPGTGYAVADVVSALNTDIGGTGLGFSVPVATVDGTLSTVTIVNNGVGYMGGDVLSFSGPGVGSGTVNVVTVTSVEIGTITLQNVQPMFTVGQNVYVINNANSACQIPWWAWTPQTAGIPAVESGQILEAIVHYTNSMNSPTVTYSVRIGSQPGVVLLDEGVVFIDKATAINAYEAMDL